MWRAQLVDDDGVIVLASAKALAARWPTRDAFDYAFPRALLAGMNAQELFAWHSGEEGEVSLSLSFAGSDAGVDAGHLVRLGDGDTLLAMPYSQYTYCCAYRHGVPAANERLCARIELPAGLYGVVVRAIGKLAFAVTLAPTDAVAMAAVTKLPMVEALAEKT